MTAASVQNVYKSSAGSASVLVHPASNLTAGNTVIGSFMLPAGVGVTSVTDNLGNPWIQVANSYTTSGGAEIWYSRGVQAGSASVTATFSTSASVGVNIAEFSGLWYVDPLDTWGANYGTNATNATLSLQPRTTNELLVGVLSYPSGSVAAIDSGYTSLSCNASVGYSAMYKVLSSSVTAQPSWFLDGPDPSSWTNTAACFVSGASGSNPRLQFPETLVQISTTSNYLNPINGKGVWTNISSYVMSMSLGPLGRQHELDRVQSTPAHIIVNNRDGSFNNWNTSSFLYNNGLGLKAMNPVKVTAAWNGITYPEYYGYFQSVTPQIHDVLNVDATISCYDIFQICSLKYLSQDLYAQLVAADGGTYLAAYYRMADAIGSNSVVNSAFRGRYYPGTLQPGPAGNPAYGKDGPFLYDASTSADLTNGTNVPNGGFSTNDNSTQPPTVYNPLDGTSGPVFYSNAAAYQSQSICVGPDNNIWSGSQIISKMTPTGTFTNYTLAGSPYFVGICVSPVSSGGDGNLWAADSSNNAVWKITTSGVGTRYNLTGATTTNSICADASGNLWATADAASLWKITTAGVRTKNTVSITYPRHVVLGPDGNLWVTGQDASFKFAIWKVTLPGLTVTKYALDSAGPLVSDGTYLWVCGNTGQMYRVSTSGTVTQFNAYTITPASGNPSTDTFTAICYDSYQNCVWVTGGSGRYWRVSQSGDIVPYQGNYFLGSDPFTSICYFPNNDSLYLGGYQGLSQVTASPFQWTFECWFKWDQTTSPSPSVAAVGTSASVAAIPNATIFQSATDGISAQIGWVTYPTNAGGATIQNAFFLGDNGTQSEYVASFIGAMPVNVFDGEWHYLVVNSGTTKIPSVYIDAYPIWPITVDYTVTSVSAITVGAIPGGSAGVNPMSSSITAANAPITISDVAMYSNKNLTTAQVESHYFQGVWFRSQEYGAANGDATAGRLNKVLKVLGLDPTPILNVPYNYKTLLFGETNTVHTTSGLNYMQSLAQTEPGLIFQERDGSISAYNSQYQYLNPTSTTSQGTFADSSSAVYHYDGTSFQITGDDLDTWNDVQVQSGRAGAQLQEWGPTESTSAAYSQSKHGPRTMQGLTALKQQNDGDALALAQNYGYWYNEPLNRIPAITIHSQSSSGNNIPQMLSRGLLDRITVQYTGQTPGPTFSQDLLIEQITHQVDLMGPTWTTTFSLSPYEIQMTPTIFGTFRFDVPEGQTGYGQLTL